MHDLSNIILISDVDGTLVDETLVIPQKNKDAIQRFVNEGGHFAICTGRAHVATSQFAQQIAVNMPCIHFNGGNVYDHRTGEELYAIFLPDTAREYLHQIRQAFPNIAAAVLMDTYYDVTSGPGDPSAFRTDNVPIRRADVEALTGSWYKILFELPPPQMEEIFQFCIDLQADDVQFVSSAAFYIEMLPKGINKALGVREMLKRTGNEGKTVVAIGDYYNDWEMIKEADVGITPANAPDDIKATADLVVCSASEGAVAEAIAYIEKTFG